MHGSALFFFIAIGLFCDCFGVTAGKKLFFTERKWS